jgi:hypothetical protein
VAGEPSEAGGDDGDELVRSLGGVDTASGEIGTLHRTSGAQLCGDGLRERARGEALGLLHQSARPPAFQPAGHLEVGAM